MTTNQQHYLAVQTGRDYVAVAKMIDRARMSGHDRQAQTVLEQRAARRLELARRDVKTDGTGKIWANADITAGQGLVRATQGHCKDAVDTINGHTREMKK